MVIQNQSCRPRYELRIPHRDVLVELHKPATTQSETSAKRLLQQQPRTWTRDRHPPIDHATESAEGHLALAGGMPSAQGDHDGGHPDERHDRDDA